jgi:hypothetical protein
LGLGLLLGAEFLGEAESNTEFEQVFEYGQGFLGEFELVLSLPHGWIWPDSVDD